MMSRTDTAPPQSTWFVGATYDGKDDQTERFLRQGIWENGYEDRYLSEVRSMRVGERIAIKSSYTRKHGLRFDNRGHAVSVMAIKATGVITENPMDGRRVSVDWDQGAENALIREFRPDTHMAALAKPEFNREWYFYTSRTTVWRVVPGAWMTDALIAFAFDRTAQDIERFCNAPYWRARFGTESAEERFAWTTFFEAVADRLLQFRSNRAPLIEGIHVIASRQTGLSYLQDQFRDGTAGPLKDICPFTVMGAFNRNSSVATRIAIAREFAALLNIGVPVPDGFDGVPLLNNQRSWFFGYEKLRQEGDIDSLWRVFSAAIRLADSNGAISSGDFEAAYNAATKVSGVKWNLSTGLFWVRPWDFPSLDSQSRRYLNDRLNLKVSTATQLEPVDATGYLGLANALTTRFAEDDYPVHSFPELSLASWQFRDPSSQTDADGEQGVASGLTGENAEVRPEPARTSNKAIPYSVEDVLKDGCFLDRIEIERLIARLLDKKNLILHGPPGTGKTWLAKRLAFALIGEKDDRRVRAVQFHRNLSYEDFVRGWRPTGDGKLALANGVFMEVIRAALDLPSSRFVVVIEEINRGNPAQIFGELLTLLEAGKRTPDEALELCYPDSDGERRPVHVPENLFVIGTMNVADRSLALVDLALRRRFAFVGLEPKLGSAWREWVVTKCGVDSTLAIEIERRITQLNDQIATDTRLGKQFQIGHSYVTPSHRLGPGATREWFRQVVETEVGPLLDEYWFDSRDEAQKACERLLQGWCST